MKSDALTRKGEKKKGRGLIYVVDVGSGVAWRFICAQRRSPKMESRKFGIEAKEVFVPSC